MLHSDGLKHIWTSDDVVRFLSLGLEVLLKDIIGRTLLTPVSDNAAAALDNLPGLTFSVNLTQASPFS